jgi:hypothetical protein
VAEFQPGSEAVWPRLAFDRVSTEWLVVRVGLELPATELHGSCMLRLLLPGLAVGSVPLGPPSGAGQTWRQSFMFPFHRGFLEARSIDRIGVCLMRDGAPLVWPGRRACTVDLLAARSAG